MFLRYFYIMHAIITTIFYFSPPPPFFPPYISGIKSTFHNSHSENLIFIPFVGIEVDLGILIKVFYIPSLYAVRVAPCTHVLFDFITTKIGKIQVIKYDLIIYIDTSGCMYVLQYS